MYGIDDPAFNRPRRVRLDICTLCQLNCPGCYMRKFGYNIGSGYMTYRQFAKFLRKNPFIKVIELSHNGEMFLNPDLYRIIRLSARKGITLSADCGVNLNTVSNKVLKALVKYDFSSMTISIDGASQEVYSKYRQNGDFNKVIENIKKINEYKKKYDSRLPVLKWQYIILESSDNVSEIKKAKEMAAELGLDISFEKDWHGYVPKNVKQVEKETGLNYSHNPNLKSKTVSRWLPCLDLWYYPQINFDGRLMGCSHNQEYSFCESVFDIGLEEALKSVRTTVSKKMLMGGGIDLRAPCYRCWYFPNLRKGNRFITESELYSGYQQS